MKKAVQKDTNVAEWKPSLRKEIIEHKSSYFLVAPFFILFTTFTIIPILASMFLSFTYFNLLEWPKFIGLQNYRDLLLADDVFWIAVRNTFKFALLTGVVSYFLCFLFAWLINDLPKKLRTLMTFVFYTPSMAGSVYVIWQFIFSGDEYGLANGFLMKIGLLTDPIVWFTDTNFNFTIIVIIILWLSLGVSFLSFIAGFQTVDRSLYEAGAIDGIRNRFQELFYITVPAMKPQMLFGAIMQLSGAFSVGAVPAALGGMPSTNYSLHTIMNHITDYGTIRYEMGYACAISFLLTIFLIILKNVLTRLLATD